MNEKISNVPYDYSLNLINCTKTIESVDQQTNFQYNHVHMSSNYQYQYSTNTNLYNNAAPTQTLKNQNLPLGMYQENVDFLNWDNNRIIINDNKIDLNELTNNKDLSPTIDTLIPTECYKTSSSLLSTANNKINPSLCEGNQSWNHIENNYQKTYELPSCAQQQIDGNNYEYDKGRYFSIEKTQEFDTFVKTTTTSSSSTTAAYTTYNNDLLNENSYRTNKLQEYNNTSFNNYYETNVIDSIENGLFQDCIPFEPIMGPPPQTPADELVDDEDEESDIIVEESEDDCGGEERIYSHMNKCVICNMIYTLHGRQFYFLTIENPLTMTTQKPVLNKMVEFVGKINTTADQNLYLCSECLSLINTIDQLQLKLKSLTTELLNKFQKTCKDNNIQCDENNQQQQQQLLPSTKYYKKNRRNVNRRYQCKICKKVLSIKKVFQLHSILKHHDNNNKIASEYLCEMCGKIFPTKTKFKFHTSSKKCSKFIPKIYGFKCTNCTKVFRTKTNLKEHENSCLGRLPYICTRENCHKKFASTTRLKNHVKLKHDKKFTSICSICNIGFVNISEYKTHMLSHSTEKKYTCTKCNKSYKTRSNLNFHMKVHNDKMPFNCTICKKGFLRKDYLEAHVNNHNGIKNFTCTICNKKFVTQKNLDSHTKYHDGSVKKYTCNICGKIMTTGFQEHLRIHNNLLEFHCDLCNVKFNTKITLSKHKKSKHSFVS